MAVGKPLNLRLFLEGIEVPVIAAAVQIGMNAPSSASVQVVPLDEGMNLKPRTMVHLFFLDAKAARNEEGVLVGGLEESYKLLFAGEVVGFSTILTPQSRALIYQCLDFSSYWDSAHATAIEYGPGGNAFSSGGGGSLSGGATGLFDDIVNQQSTVIIDWLSQTPKTEDLKTVTGLAGGIIRMMEAMGGSIPHHKGVNDFFTVAELRCRLLAQVTAEEGDYTARNIMRGTVFMEWLKNGLQNIGQQVTFRDMMLLVMKYIYYDFVPNPAAHFSDGSITARSVSKKTVPLANMQEALVANGYIRMARDVISGAVVGSLELNAIYCNTLIVKAEESLGEALAHAPTLSVSIDRVKNLLLKARIMVQSVIRDIAAEGKNGTELFNTAGKILRDASRELDDSTVTTTTVRPGSVKSSRMHSHIFRPDCWFAPAPVCNVIFPEQFSQVSYDRNFISEVTRLYVGVFTNLIGRSDVLDSFKVIAPNNGFDVEALVKETGIEQYRVLMDHELHTGIIPRSEWLSDTMTGSSRLSPEDGKTSKGKRLQWVDRIALFHFFKYRFAGRALQVAGRFNPGVVCGFPGVVIRRPFIVLGGDVALTKELFSDVLGTGARDPQEILDFIQAHAEELGAPAQFIGMISTISHNLNQDGGGTVVSMSHARTHMGTDDDFVAVFLEQFQKSTKRLIKTTLNYQQIQNDPELRKMLADATPQGAATDAQPRSAKKSVVQVQLEQAKKNRDPRETTNGVQSSTFSTVSEGTAASDAEIAPPFTAYSKIPKAGLEHVLVPSPQGLLFEKKGRYGGTIIAVQVNNSNLVDTDDSRRMFQEVTIFEEVTVPVSKKIPLEQVMRPPWFSAKYDNRSIGEKIYQPFFGCGSIIDNLLVSGFREPEESSTDSTGAPFGVDRTVQEVIQQLISQEESRVSVTVEKAVNVLSYLYGQVRQKGLDVDEFIRQINYRPIATMTDIFGANLDYDVAPNGVATPKKMIEGEGDFKVGFHSSATHERLVLAGGLAGLLDNPGTDSFTRIGKTGKKESVSPRYDIRLAKRTAVLEYCVAFNTTRAFRG